GNTPAFKFSLARNPKFSAGRTGGYDDRTCSEVQFAPNYAKATLDFFQLLNAVEGKFCPSLVRLHLQGWAQFEAGHPFRRAGEILEAVDIDNLAACAKLVDDQRIQSISGCSNSGVEAGNSGPDDDDVVIHVQRHSSTDTVVR